VADLAIITPTRGRPERFAELVEAVEKTAGGDVLIVSCVDEDDPTRAEYDRLTPPTPGQLRYYGPRRSLSMWTNQVALNMPVLQGPDAPRYLASLGDDHRPRTHGWDRILIDAIEGLPGGFGFAYGNDLLQGEQMPTAWVVSADVVRALNWMMLPSCEHMYVDNAILALGQAADRIVYCPEVIVEHVHPVAGKAAWDASYRASNAPARYGADRAAFEAWRASGLATDAAKLTALHAHLGRR
jgi:hypothetical protein